MLWWDLARFTEEEDHPLYACVHAFVIEGVEFTTKDVAVEGELGEFGLGEGFVLDHGPELGDFFKDGAGAVDVFFFFLIVI